MDLFPQEQEREMMLLPEAKIDVVAEKTRAEIDDIVGVLTKKISVLVISLDEAGHPGMITHANAI